MTREFNGRIVSKDGHVIYARVSGTIDIYPSGRLYEWDGALTIESREHAGTFRGFIVTDDGGRGELFATHVTLGADTIEFQGIGPAPFHVP
jgi:hypothetical protein